MITGALTLALWRTPDGNYIRSYRLRAVYIPQSKTQNTSHTDTLVPQESRTWLTPCAPGSCWWCRRFPRKRGSSVVGRKFTSGTKRHENPVNILFKTRWCFWICKRALNEHEPAIHPFESAQSGINNYFAIDRSQGEWPRGPFFYIKRHGNFVRNVGLMIDVHRSLSATTTARALKTLLPFQPGYTVARHQDSSATNDWTRAGFCGRVLDHLPLPYVCSTLPYLQPSTCPSFGYYPARTKEVHKRRGKTNYLRSKWTGGSATHQTFDVTFFRVGCQTFCCGDQTYCNLFTCSPVFSC